MTREHRDEVRGRLTNEPTKVSLLRDVLDAGLNLDVADPYYGDALEFDECLDKIRRVGRCLTSVLRRRLGADSSEA